MLPNEHVDKPLKKTRTTKDVFAF